MNLPVGHPLALLHVLSLNEREAGMGVRVAQMAGLSVFRQLHKRSAVEDLSAPLSIAETPEAQGGRWRVGPRPHYSCHNP